MRMLIKKQIQERRMERSTDIKANDSIDIDHRSNHLMMLINFLPQSYTRDSYSSNIVYCVCT